jgi:hypothetical protein
MSLKYEILTTVTFRHTYFNNNSYAGFTIVPDASTLHHLRRLSILFKPTPNGCNLLFEVDSNHPRTREEVLKEAVTFGFSIHNNDPDFVNYTEGLPGNIEKAVLFFRNNTAETAVISDNGLLHENPFFSVKDILQNKSPDKNNIHDKEFFSKPFAWMEIRLHKGLEKSLQVNFKGKETLWRYIINSEHLQELAEPAVIHKDTKEAFKGPVWIVLPDGKKRMAFESNKLIPLCSKPEKVFQLVENFQPGSAKYKVVLGMLPNPNVKLISLIRSEDITQENKFSEIFI